MKGKYEEFPDGSYIIEGTVVKNRWGHKDRSFHLFVLAGYGVHLGLTAMYDLIDLGLVERGRTIKMDGVSFGSLKEIIMKAHEGDNDYFIPFYQKLAHPDSIMENLEGYTIDDEDSSVEVSDNEDTIYVSED